MPGFNIVPAFGGGNGFAPTASVKPVMVYAWQIPGLFGEATAAKANNPLIYLRDCTPPEHSFDIEEIETASTKLKYASRITWNDVKVTFYDTIGLLAYVRDWRNMVWRPDAGIQVESAYKKDSIIELLSMDGNITASWRLYGSWPKSISHAGLTYTSSDIHQVSVTIAYDWADISI